MDIYKKNSYETLLKFLEEVKTNAESDLEFVEQNDEKFFEDFLNNTYVSDIIQEKFDDVESPVKFSPHLIFDSRLEECYTKPTYDVQILNNFNEFGELFGNAMG